MLAKWCAVFAVAVLIGGCAAETSAESDSQESTRADLSTSSTPTRTPVITERLDSIAVLGHSWATGTLTDPSDYRREARENSWATGDNPQVRSLYLRLLQSHPALEGHNYNEAVGGTGVDNLQSQFDYLLDEADPLPDLVIIQTIDNDMRCDGSDADNYGPYGATLDHALTRIEEKIPGVQFFIVSQPITVKRWSGWAVHHPPLVKDYTGTGPCDVFDQDGRTRTAGVRSMQQIVDSYWKQIERVCATHPQCFTDGRAEQRKFLVTDSDMAVDLNHPSLAGHRKFAAIAWQALPDEIKRRP
jgi:hypothetical protein